MGTSHRARVPTVKWFTCIVVLVSVFICGVLGDKAHKNRIDSAPKKAKQETVTVPLAVNIWKPYTPRKLPSKRVY